MCLYYALLAVPKFVGCLVEVFFGHQLNDDEACPPKIQLRG
jgi:hypothetical protein